MELPPVTVTGLLQMRQRNPDPSREKRIPKYVAKILFLAIATRAMFTSMEITMP